MGIGIQDKLSEKSVLVTGASKGVGKAIVETLSAYNMKIGLLARSRESLEKLQDNVIASGGDAIVLCADLRKQKDVENAASDFKDKFGIPDFLINNAGVGARGYWEDISLEAELDMATINYMAPVILIRQFLPEMVKRNSGHIININTLGGMYAAPFQSAYCGSKAALLAYVTSLAYELEQTRVHISSIFTGPIDTDFLNNPNYECFKQSKEIITPYDVADKVLAIINHPQERVYIGPFWKLLAVKIANLNPIFFRKKIEKKNKPPKKIAFLGNRKNV